MEDNDNERFTPVAACVLETLLLAIWTATPIYLFYWILSRRRMFRCFNTGRKARYGWLIPAGIGLSFAPLAWFDIYSSSWTPWLVVVGGVCLWVVVLDMRRMMNDHLGENRVSLWLTLVFHVFYLQYVLNRRFRKEYPQKAFWDRYVFLVIYSFSLYAGILPLLMGALSTLERKWVGEESLVHLAEKPGFWVYLILIIIIYVVLIYSFGYPPKVRYVLRRLKSALLIAIVPMLLATPFFILKLDHFSAFFSEKIVTSDYWDLGDRKEYRWEEVKWVALDYSIKRFGSRRYFKPLFTFHFRDGSGLTVDVSRELETVVVKRDIPIEVQSRISDRAMEVLKESSPEFRDWILEMFSR